jgi:guanylate kinase
MDRIGVSISHTTRAMRPGEQDGVDYHFVNRQEFNVIVEAGGFIEYAQVFDHWYGTARSDLAALLRQGEDVILEIDWQGARQVHDSIQDCFSIFIVPPTREALELRLRGRGQDAEEVIQRRLSKAVAEMQHFAEFDYLVINDEFNRALNDLRSIVVARRLRLEYQRERQLSLMTKLLNTG